MNYHPKYRTAKEIVELAGFYRPLYGIGYEKRGACLEGYVSRSRLKKPEQYFDRLHAHIHTGYIELHIDIERPKGHHQSKKNGVAVERMVEEFRRIDLEAQPVSPVKPNFIHRLLGLLKLVKNIWR